MLIPELLHRKFYYVRHGQTDWNLIRKLQGSSDVPLNDTGLAQAHEAKEKLAGKSISAIYCSPLMRARKTADVINEALNSPLYELDGLREWNFGSSEGSKYFPWLHELFNGDMTNVPGDVEPAEAFLERSAGAINHALEHPADDENPVLIVAHGGTYMPANKNLQRDQQWSLPNCQPVRHDPPLEEGGSWTKTCL